MCNYRVLFQNEATGFVVQCRQCQHWQLAFGNILLTLNSTQFHRFHQYVTTLETELAPGFSESLIRCITLALPCRQTQLLLSYPELATLSKILNLATEEALVQEMLGLFQTS